MFDRFRHISAHKTGDSTLEVTSILRDTLHEVSLRMSVDMQSQEIKAVSVEFSRGPYTVCRDVAPLAERIVGLKVQEGIIRQLREQLGGGQGCHQLLDVAVEGVKAVFQTLDFFMEGTEEEVFRYWDESLRGTCYTHSQATEVLWNSRDLPDERG